MIDSPSVFLSHAHEDKHVARRLAREMRPYGFCVWIDEAELRFGAVLSDMLRAQIEQVDAFLVVASAASVASPWVALDEVRHAVKHGKVVIPVFIEPVTNADLFRDHLGVDAISPIRFAEVVHRLMAGLLSDANPQPREPDHTIMESDLRALALEEPDLAPLIVGYLDGDGVGYEQTALYGVNFHALDYALAALLELKRTEEVALSAATGFHRVGAGAAALSHWIAISGDGGLPLDNAVGGRLRPELVGPALELLGRCKPPNNHALYQFIHHNSASLNAQQRRSALSLVTSPMRGPERFGDVLGSVALKHFPGEPGIVQMWTRWIWAGAFDGTPSTPSDLARALALAERDQPVTSAGLFRRHGRPRSAVPEIDQLHDALRAHVRSYLRSGDTQKVALAVDHLQANVDERTGVVAALCREAAGVSATAEWEHWAERDPESAGRMSHYVFAHLQQAESGGDWLEALRDFERMVEFDRLRRQCRSEG